MAAWSAAARRLVDPGTQRSISGVFAVVAYLGATETISSAGRAFGPWLTEVVLAAGLALVAYLVYLLAQILGAQLARLSLSAIVVGFGGRERLVEWRSREILMLRWPPRVSLRWAGRGRALRLRLVVPALVPVVVFGSLAVAIRMRGYADSGLVDPWRSAGGVVAAALLLAVVPWPYGPDRGSSTATWLWALPRLPAAWVRQEFGPPADPRIRRVLFDLRRAAYRCDPEAASRAVAQLAEVGVAPAVVSRCTALALGLRGEFVAGARAAARNLEGKARADVTDVSLLVANVLGGLETGREMPADLVDLMRKCMGVLVRGCPRGEAAEKIALLALQDDDVGRAEVWAQFALSTAVNDIVEGDALLTLARVRSGQGRAEEAREVLERARRIHPRCPRWTAVLAAVTAG